jgi:Flp pilus assembly protein protease CpaA
LKLVSAAGLGLSFAIMAWARFGLTLSWLAVLPIVVALAVVVVTDLVSRRIPDAVTIPGIVYCLLRAAFVPGGPSILQAGLGIAICGGAVLLLAIVSRGGIGGGDIKLTAMLGGMLGWREALIAFALSQVVGGAIAVILLAAGRRGRRDHLPIGSLIATFGVMVLITQS